MSRACHFLRRGPGDARSLAWDRDGCATQRHSSSCMALHGASSRHALCFGLYCADTEVSCSSSPTEHAVKPVAVLVMVPLSTSLTYWGVSVRRACWRDEGWVSAEALADDPRTSATCMGCRRRVGETRDGCRQRH